MGQTMRPDLEVMLDFVGRLFGDQTAGLVELAWRDPEIGSLTRARLFGLDEFEELAGTAARINAEPGSNAYVGAALRREDAPRDRRACDRHFLAAPAYWADLDTPEANRNVRQKCGAVPATVAVLTGRHPHPRAQLYWCRETPISDPTALRHQNDAIATQLAGDRSVVNPGRILRLPGSIAWPVKSGRVAEMVDLVTFDDRPAAYVEGEIEKAFTPSAAPDLDFGLQTAGDPERWINVLRDGVTEGARNSTAAALAGHLLRRDLDVEVVEEILGLWNSQRCRPPLDPVELDITVQSICKRELARRGAT